MSRCWLACWPHRWRRCAIIDSQACCSPATLACCWLQSLIEETIERITQKEGVDGFFVVDDEGNMLRCKNLSEEFARSISDIAHALVSRARHVVRDIHATVCDHGQVTMRRRPCWASASTGQAATAYATPGCHSACCLCLPGRPAILQDEGRRYGAHSCACSGLYCGGAAALDTSRRSGGLAAISHGPAHPCLFSSSHACMNTSQTVLHVTLHVHEACLASCQACTPHGLESSAAFAIAPHPKRTRAQRQPCSRSHTQ